MSKFQKIFILAVFVLMGGLVLGLANSAKAQTECTTATNYDVTLDTKVTQADLDVCNACWNKSAKDCLKCNFKEEGECMIDISDIQDLSNHLQFPDLTIKSITFTPEKSTYLKTDNVRIKTVIKNIGDVEAGALELNYSDRYSDGGQDKVKPLYSYSLPSITLDPGEEYVDEIAISQWAVSGGNTLEVTVDYAKRITEKDENNNTAARSFWYDSPVPLTIYLPAGMTEFIQGQSYVIKWDAALTVFNDKMNLDLYKGGVYNSSIVSGVLASAKSYSWTVPTTLSVGTDYAIRIYDPRYPTDFVTSGQFSISAPSQQLPDLVVKDVEFYKDYTSPQSHNVLVINFCNNGTKYVQQPEVGIKWKVNNFTKTDAILSMALNNGECSKYAFGSGINQEVIPQAGYYDIIVEIDTTNVVQELNETNNSTNRRLYFDPYFEKVFSISNVQHKVEESKATITWDTNFASNSSVYYYYMQNGKKYENWNWDKVDDYAQTKHIAILMGLQLNTTYYYTVSSQQAQGNKITSETNSFTTALVNQPPVITGTSGPTSLKINETGTWNVEAYDPDGTYLTYNVDWGDATTKADKSTTAPSVKTTQKATFTHSYSQNGIYTITFTVTDDKGASAKSTLSVKVSVELLPDLYISQDFTMFPTLQGEGATNYIPVNELITITYKIKNSGEVSAFLSGIGAVTTGTIQPSGGFQSGGGDCGSTIAPKSYCTGTATFILTEIGSYTIIFEVDPSNRIVESDETDNKLTIPATVKLRDNSKTPVIVSSGPFTISDIGTNSAAFTWETNIETQGFVYVTRAGETVPTMYVDAGETETTVPYKTKHRITAKTLYHGTTYSVYAGFTSRGKITGYSGVETFTTTLANHPLITSISPTSGPVGTTLTINGDNLLKYSLLGIYFGSTKRFDLIIYTRGSQYTYTFVSDEQLLISVPDGAETGKVTLEFYTPSGYYNAVGPVFTVEPGSVEPKKKPDLAITKLIFEPEKPAMGDYLDVSYAIKNIGEAESGPFDIILDSVDDRTDHIWLLKGVEASLLPGQSIEQKHAIIVGAKWGSYERLQAGENTVQFRVDPDQKIAEIDESNNIITKEITVSPAAGTPTVKIDQDTIKIRSKAKLLAEDKTDVILKELQELRNLVREQQTRIKYLEKLVADTQKLTAQTEERLNSFIAYGVDENTKKLGTGERANILASYKQAFKELPDTEAEITDAIRIANGRWPEQRSQDMEKWAKDQFKKVYLREPNLNNANDSAAIMVMAYGLRQNAKNRNLNSEKTGIGTFKSVYGYVPKEIKDWNIMQAITYSGAKR